MDTIILDNCIFFVSVFSTMNMCLYFYNKINLGKTKTKI